MSGKKQPFQTAERKRFGFFTEKTPIPQNDQTLLSNVDNILHQLGGEFSDRLTVEKYNTNKKVDTYVATRPTS